LNPGDRKSGNWTAVQAHRLLEMNQRASESAGISSYKENTMSNASRRNEKDSTSSGQGALGMGGQPSDDPRDSNSGSETLKADDRGSRTGPVDGAFGPGSQSDNSANEVVGVPGDKDFDAAQKAAGRK
jgi:hypothetical protein